MKFLIIFCCLLQIALLSARILTPFRASILFHEALPIVVNEFLDQTLEKIDNEKSNPSELNVTEIKFGDVTLNSVTLRNLKTLKRSGDAIMMSESRRVSITSDLMLEEMTLTAQQMLIGSNNITIPSPTLKFNNNIVNFLFKVELDTKSGCQIKQQLLKWKQLEGTIFSGNPQYNNKAFNLSKEQIDSLNKNDANNEEFLKYLKTNMIVCDKLKESPMIKFFKYQLNV
ncbi:hypothetical protein O3M35_002831 [Rhynocoris fuscipes]|uniref:Uncharacterized protein n=1 Tax=Rhynocoris fuscipes TaxID=488301 RepID=A0AAW1CQ84_9HEMI